MRRISWPAGSDEEWKTDLRRLARSLGSFPRLDEVEPYELHRVVGVVTRLRIDPINRMIETTISDGTGSLVAHLGVERIQEVIGALGSWIALEGVTRIGSRGEVMILEPRVEVVLHSGEPVTR